MEKKVFVLFFCLFFVQSLFAGKEELQFIKNLNDQTSKNITKEYLALDTKEVKLFEENFLKKKNIKVIFLPGYLSKEILKLYDYFDDQINYLNSIGVESEKLPLTSAKGIEVNSDIIIEKLKKEKKQLIIISHSKGGLDFLHALVKSAKKKDELWTKNIVGWIAIQSPFYGSPVADDIDKLKFLTKGFLFLFDGEYQSLEDLMIKNRKKYMESNSADILYWISKLSIITLSTYIEPVKFKNIIQYLFLGGQNTIMAGIRDYYYKKKIYIDGLVPYQSAILPATGYIFFNNVDHLSTVSKNKYNQFERVDFTRKAIFMVLKKNKTMKID